MIQRLAIDSADFCVGRFINSNHNTTKEANVVFKNKDKFLKKLKDEDVVYFVAKQDIKTGSELLVDYGDNYFDGVYGVF